MLVISAPSHRLSSITAPSLCIPRLYRRIRACRTAWLCARCPTGTTACNRSREVYRGDWQLDVAPAQWNFVLSKPNTLRGVHAHLGHWDYLHVVSGEMLLGLHDLRPGSPTYRMAVQCRLAGDRPGAIAIPPGVAHGFYFASATTYFYALSHYWTSTGDLGCRWDDPALGLSWPTSDPLLSQRDANASSYEELAKAVATAKALVRS